MTSPIKPPGGPKPPSVPVAPATGSPEGAEAFREALAVDPTQSAAGAESTGGVDAVVADLKAGRIDAQTAVDRLVAETLQGPMASMLDAAGRVELEAHIRTTLENDPSLVALVRDMDR